MLDLYLLQKQESFCRSLGYNKLIDGLLDGIETRIGVDFSTLKDTWNDIAGKLLYTGAIDEYFDYCYGKFEYRTVRFETEILDIAIYQVNVVVNYIEREVLCTCVIEHKHFEMSGQEVYDCSKTVMSKEYSTEWQQGMELIIL